MDETRSYWWAERQHGDMGVAILLFGVIEVAIRMHQRGIEAWETERAIAQAARKDVHEIPVVSTGETIRFTLSRSIAAAAVARAKKARPKKSPIGGSRGWNA